MSDRQLRQTDVTVETSQYQFAHGHKPRGRGRWGFELDGHLDGSSVPAEELWSDNWVSFSEARRQAVREAAARGFMYVRVMT